MNKTQTKILNAAFAILSKDISAPLERVAEQAGVTRMTLHRYYNGREALLEATGLEMIRLGNEIIDEAVAQHPDPLKQLESIIKSASQMGDRFHFLMHAHEVIDEEVLMPLVTEMDNKLVRVFDQLREKKLIDSNVPNAWLLHLYGGIMTAAWSSLQEGAVASRDVPNLSWQSFSNGILKSG